LLSSKLYHLGKWNHNMSKENYYVTTWKDEPALLSCVMFVYHFCQLIYDLLLQKCFVKWSTPSVEPTSTISCCTPQRCTPSLQFDNIDYNTVCATSACLLIALLWNGYQKLQYNDLIIQPLLLLIWSVMYCSSCNISEIHS